MREDESGRVFHTVDELIEMGVISPRNEKDIDVHDIQQEMETAECYMAVVGYEGVIALLCTREECAPSHTVWEEKLPYNCLPEFAVLRRAKHLATHHDT